MSATIHCTCAPSGPSLAFDVANAFSGGEIPTLAVLALSRLCYETLLESGLQAKLAVERKVVTPALEAIVEANTLLSGLSSENGGHAAAHSIHNGLTTLAATRGLLHGEKVAFGLLAQLVLDGADEGGAHGVVIPLDDAIVHVAPTEGDGLRDQLARRVQRTHQLVEHAHELLALLRHVHAGKELAHARIHLE